MRNIPRGGLRLLAYPSSRIRLAHKELGWVCELLDLLGKGTSPGRGLAGGLSGLQVRIAACYEALRKELTSLTP